MRVVFGFILGMSVFAACDEVLDAVPEWTAKRLIILDTKDFTPEAHPIGADGTLDKAKLEAIQPPSESTLECYVEHIDMKREELTQAFERVPYAQCHNNWLAMHFDDWDTRSTWYNGLLANIRAHFD